MFFKKRETNNFCNSKKIYVKPCILRVHNLKNRHEIFIADAKCVNVDSREREREEIKEKLYSSDALEKI